MKRLFFILAALVIISAFIFTGCSSTPSNTPPNTSKPASTTSAPAVTSAPAATPPAASASASTGTITLKFSYDMPATGTIVPGWTWWADQVQKQSNGRVKIDFYPAAALFDQANSPDSLKAGVADIANISFTAHSKLEPITNVFALAGMEFPDTDAGLVAAYNAYLQLSQKYTAISSEMADYKVLMWVPNPAYRIVSKKQISVPGDLKGMKIGGSAAQGQIVQMAGGTAVQVVPPNMYENISKGIIEGGFVFWGQVSVFKLNEVANYFLDYGFTQESQQICVNLNTWNSLPPGIQKIMMDLVPESVARSTSNSLAVSQKSMQAVKDSNKTIITPTPEQGKAWETLVVPIQDEWVKNAESKGVSNAATILSDLKALRAKAMAAQVK